MSHNAVALVQCCTGATCEEGQVEEVGLPSKLQLSLQLLLPVATQDGGSNVKQG